MSEVIWLIKGVTYNMGFIAENIREHLTERKIARQNLEAYKNDLLQHQLEYSLYTKAMTLAMPVYDSIVSILYTNNENKELPTLSRLLLKGQLNFLIVYYKVFTIQIFSLTRKLKELSDHNTALVNRIDQEVGE
jgi:hypothetical protein